MIDEVRAQLSNSRNEFQNKIENQKLPPLGGESVTQSVEDYFIRRNLVLGEVDCLGASRCRNFSTQ